MIDPFNVYKHYPFKIPVRVRFFNLFRYFFTIPFLERFLVSRLSSHSRGWHRLIPPLYFYRAGSIRRVESDGLKYELDISRLIDHSIYFYKLNEPTWEILFNYIHHDSHVVDVGANIGFLSLRFAKIVKKGMVYSFEPDSENFKNLKNNVELNNFNNVKVFNKALGAKSETVLLYKIYTNNPGANRILFEKPELPHKVERVEVGVFDDVADQQKISRVDVMKIDVEGFEIFVLQGALNIIAKCKPILFVELAEVNLRQHGYTAMSLVEFIENLGYDVKDARTMKVVDRHKPDYHTDIICLPVNKAH